MEPFQGYNYEENRTPRVRGVSPPLLCCVLSSSTVRAAKSFYRKLYFTRYRALYAKGSKSGKLCVCVRRPTASCPSG